MKAFKSIFFVAFIAILFGCEEEELQIAEFSDVTWYNSFFKNEDYRISINEVATFVDLSKNETSHQWIIEEGARFIARGYNTQDTSLNKYVVDGLSTSEKFVNIQFI